MINYMVPKFINQLWIFIQIYYEEKEANCKITKFYKDLWNEK